MVLAQDVVLSLKQSSAIQGLAGVMARFLPGSGASNWTGHVTFATIADRVGIGHLCPDKSQGNKRRRLTVLLEGAYEHDKTVRTFQHLVLGIVREGLIYTKSKGEPITANEMKRVNGHLLELNVKIPQLWDDGFLDAIKDSDSARAQRNVEQAEREQEIAESEGVQRRRELEKLKEDLVSLSMMEDRQGAGLKLEVLLNSLFELSGLEPRSPFKIIGEQIDGSFMLGDEVYLLEAKWEQGKLPEAPLLVFQGKVKAPFGRGVFIAMNGITSEAEMAIRTRNAPNFFVLTGHDLMMVLQGAMTLPTFLRERWRVFVEEGLICPPFSRLLKC